MSVLGGGDTHAQTESAIVAEAVSGSHVLRVEGYSQTIGLGVGKCVDSCRFIVGGHSCHIRYYPDGFTAGYGDWISLAVVLDARNVVARLELSLLDQVGKPVPAYTIAGDQMSHISSPTDEQWWCFGFIKRKDLEQSAYLKGDCFRVRCDVHVTKQIRVVEEAPTAPPFLVPPSDMHQHLGQLLSGGVGADVTFEVGGETFSAHRCVLAGRSSVFMAELYGPMKEKSTSCVRIDGMEAEAFRALLHFIYTDSLPDMDNGDTVAMAQHLLVSADRYNLERLKFICEAKLCSHISTSTVATTLALAEQHGCRRLKEACFSFLLESPGTLHAVMLTDDFDHLRSSCPSVLKELIAKLAPLPRRLESNKV